MHRCSGILVSVPLSTEFWEGLGFMQVNDLGFVASILFVLVPTVFLLILYIQTASQENKNS